MADVTPADAPASGAAPVTTPADATAAPSGTLLTQGEPSKPTDPSKPEGEKPADKPADAPKPVVPEKYEFKVPDGMQIDSAVTEALTPAFKELGLTQEQVNKLVEPYNKAMLAAEAKRDSDFQDWMKTNAQNYEKSIRKEWGNEFDANLKVAQRGLARVFGPEGKKLLDETGLGSHPEFLKAFHTVGKMIQEDQPPAGGQPSGRKPLESVLYPSTPGSH
jgi:hypothetical protein